MGFQNGKTPNLDKTKAPDLKNKDQELVVKLAFYLTGIAKHERSNGGKVVSSNVGLYPFDGFDRGIKVDRWISESRDYLTTRINKDQ